MSTVSITYAEVPGFPAGSVVDHIVVSAVGTVAANSQTQNVAPATASVTFTFVPDTYTISAQGADASGNLFGTAVTTTLTVSAPVTVSLNLPSAVTAA